MRPTAIVSFLAVLGLFICSSAGSAFAGDEEPPEKHLDPLETIARFQKLVQAGKSSDIKAAAKLIDPDHGDQAWANDQLDSAARDMLTSMRVYDFASIFAKDPPEGDPVYALPRSHSNPAPATPVAAVSPPASSPATTPLAEPAATEATADRATVMLASGRTVALVKNAAGVWLLVEYSSSLGARADWAATRDRDLDLPPAGQFKDFFLDMARHKPDYAWRVAMALGEAGRFADLSRLIDLPPDAGPPVPQPVQPGAPPDPKAVREREAFLEEQGRLLYSWLRHSMPARIRLEASSFNRPTASAATTPTTPSTTDASADLPVADGKVANFLIWTNDRKRVRLNVHVQESPESLLEVGTPVYEWRFDASCYSPESKRAWIHSRPQDLSDQP